jgi:macrolide transport system ATP-binding/permease protein
MASWKRVLSRALEFTRKRKTEDELSREMEAHLTLLEDDFARRGLCPAEARAAANRTFGNPQLTKELVRDERYFVWLEQAWQDLRYGIRSLAHSPGFALTAVITLALGIGVNTTLFVAYNALVLKPLPVAEPDRVLRWERWFKNGSVGDIQYGFSQSEFEYCQDRNDVFSSVVAASWPVPVLSQIEGQVKRAEGQLVSSGYFSGLGIGVERGNAFLSGGDPVIVISHSFWQTAMNGRSDIVGRVIKLNGTAFTVVGITRPDFAGTSISTQRVPDFWAPLSAQAALSPGRNWAADPGVRNLQILARLNPGTKIGQAQAQVDTLVRQLAKTHVEPDPTTAVTLQHTAYFGNTEDIRFKAIAAGLMLIVGMVLMVACANIANMLLARGAAREREIGVRLALGAGRGRLIRQFLTESFLLSAIGGAAGLMLSQWTGELLWTAVQPALGGFSANTNAVPVDFSSDSRVVCYTLALSFGTAFLFGLSPALRLTRPDISSGMKGSRLSNVLVTAQVAISMLLLVSSGLLMRGMVRAQAADPGFETRHLMVLNAEFGSTPGRATEMQKRLVDRLQKEPSIRGAAMGSIPLYGSWTPPIAVDGIRGRTAASYASETFLDTIGIGLSRGRGFSRSEEETGANVAVISEATAKAFWPNQDPLGKRFDLDLRFTGKLTGFTVIGVARDVRFVNLTRLDPAHVYLPVDPARPQAILLRTPDRRSALEVVSKTVRSLDESMLSDLSLETLEEGPLRLEHYRTRMMSTFCSILAGLAMTLSAVGIYGVMSFLVSRRVKEIGIRMALGARPGSVLASVLLQGFRPVLVGLGLGFAGAAAMSWALHQSLVFPNSSDLLYGIPFYDPATFFGLAAFLLFVATLASGVPARRALRVDPMEALRHE